MKRSEARSSAQRAFVPDAVRRPDGASLLLFLDASEQEAQERRLSRQERAVRLFKKSVKDALLRCGVFVFLNPPRGVSVAHDLRGALPGQKFSLIFDVGANVGQSAKRYLKEFEPDRIICFEPSRSHHAKLATMFAGEGRVSCEQLALGSCEGGGTLMQTQDPTMYHLADSAAAKPVTVPTIGAEPVRVTTVDRYCAQAGIDFIDFLKIDTEGHDYEVIVGADDMLSDERVGALQCECSVSPENTFHVGFDTVRSHLEMKGYRLFGIYEQVHEWMAKTPNLRRVNAVFVSRGFMHSHLG